MSHSTPALRSARARRAALLGHAAGATNTEPARAAFHSRWEAQVDPKGLLESAERVRRAAFARRAFYVELGIRSAESRARRSARHPESTG